MVKKATNIILLALITLLVSIPAYAGVVYDDIGPGLKALYNNNILFIMTKSNSDDNTDFAVMYDYSEGSEKAPAPWNSIKKEIKEISIGDGVTGISAEAFSGCVNVEDVSLYASLNRDNSLGKNAFSKCESLEAVYFYGTRKEWDELRSRNANTGNDDLLKPEYIHYMKEPLKLSKYSVTFDKPGYGYPKDPVSIYVVGDCDGAKSCESSNPAVAEVKNYGSSLLITPVWEGECSIRVSGPAGDDAEIKVKVTNAWARYTLDYLTRVEKDEYGSTSVQIYTEDGVKGVFTIAGDKYSFTAPNGTAKIKLKKVYKYKAKYTLAVQKDAVSCTKTGKLGCTTDLFMIKSSKARPKAVILEMESLHKGDVVKFIYKGKTYTKKIKKNYHDKTCEFKLALKDKLLANSKVTVKVINRYKQLVFRQNVVVTNWWYDYLTDDDEND